MPTASDTDLIIAEAICEISVALLFTIPGILGHASIQMMARYSQATSERTRAALEKLAATLSQPANIPTADVPVNCSKWKGILRSHG